MKRKNIGSGSDLELEIGFSRAVRAGNMIMVSGTAPIDENGETFAKGDIFEQTSRCLEIIKSAIDDAGGCLESISRTRVMLTDMSCWHKAALAHRSFFGEIRPACTFMEVSRFINPDWLVEVEADCVLG